MNRLILLGGLLACCLGGCEDRGQLTPRGEPAPTPPPVASAALHPTLAAPDQDFLAKAAGDDAFQIAMARLALQQSRNAELRALAERVMRDHTRMNAELAKISERRHTERPSPPVMVKQIEEMQAHLGRLHGEAFEHAFAGMMVADHQRVIAMFEGEIRGGQDPAVRAFARGEIDTLREHLGMANMLLNNGKPAAAHS
jgi:putative membrane protein